jgi:hypothetical protein
MGVTDRSEDRVMNFTRADDFAGKFFQHSDLPCVTALTVPNALLLARHAKHNANFVLVVSGSLEA